MIPGDLLSAFPHRQFHTLPGLLDSWAAIKAQFLGFNDVMSSLRIGHSGTIEHVMLPAIAEYALVDLFLVVNCFWLCPSDKCCCR